MTQATDHISTGLGPPNQRPRRRQMRDRTLIQLFIGPTLILLILMNIFPLVYSLYLSFTEYSVISGDAPTWVGIQNYQDILTDQRFWGNFAVTGRYALLSVSLQMIVGFGLAMLLRSKFFGSGLLTTLILVPMMLSPVVVGVFWRLIFNPSIGIFNQLIFQPNPNTGPEWLGEPNLALWAVRPYQGDSGRLARISTAGEFTQCHVEAIIHWRTVR